MDQSKYFRIEILDPITPNPGPLKKVIKITSSFSVPSSFPHLWLLDKGWSTLNPCDGE